MTFQRMSHEWRGYRLSWWEAGSGSRRIVLLHGGGGTGKAWAHQLTYLSQLGYHVIAPDMPGFGQSDWLEGVTRVDQLGPALADWFFDQGWTSFVLGGNSMGGRVALSLASHHPEPVEGLIILDSVGVRLPDVPILNPLSLPPQQFMSGLVHDPSRYKTATPYRTLEDAQELNRGRQSFARYLGEEGITADPTLDLSRLTMPSLLIWGRHDRIVPLAYGQALRQALPDAELLVIEDCGHLPHIETPELTNQAIHDFLTRRIWPH
ncbi:alpha/beta hydrolase fold protein [Sulfobacillus acidophilus DSM 10332]|uniref:Alpha/beta hydrolase fold protein n=1 Tax=Sulfobacillus acidophilus (strain ATCC 700253 / DSM 10332 / NAL) TaxID=679936 RepID=G8TXV5_SULAD|nr:alpha/beta hydrolase fold protein [Sulfobacillus acidophilus DSM 10332]